MRPSFRRHCRRWPRRSRPNKAPGVDAAKNCRLADRNSVRQSVDSKDRQAAKELHRASQRKGKRGKNKQKRVFEQSWFQALGLAGMLMIVSTLVYVAFRQPTAHALFDKVSKVMRSDDFEAKLRARSGPIDQYLRLYGKEDTSEAEQVHRWADEIDVAQREKTLANRIKASMSPDNDAEKDAREALSFEDKIEYAKGCRCLATSTQIQGSDRCRFAPSLGLVAEKHLRELARSEEDEKALQEEVQQSITAERFDTGQRPPQNTAMRHCASRESVTSDRRSRNGELWQPRRWNWSCRPGATWPDERSKS